MKLIRAAAIVSMALSASAFAGSLIISGESDATPAVTTGSGVKKPSADGAAPAATPAAGGQAVRTWRVESGDVRLSTTLERWSAEAGYMLIWDAQKQVLLSAKDSFSGTLEEAITRALSSPAIRRSEYPLEACFYPNSPPVIRVTRLGEQAEECPL